MIHQDVYEHLGGVACWSADVFEALSHNPLRTTTFPTCQVEATVMCFLFLDLILAFSVNRSYMIQAVGMNGLVRISLKLMFRLISCRGYEVDERI